MRRAFILTTALSCLVALVLVIGCSDDKSTTPELGDPNDPNFQFVYSLVGDDMFSEIGTSMEMSLDLLESEGFLNLTSGKGSPILGLQDGPGDVIISAVDTFYFTDDYWFVFVFSADLSEGQEYFEVSGIDSVQLLNQGEPLHFSVVEGGFDGLKANAHVNVSSSYGIEGGSHHRLEAEVVSVFEADSLIRIDGSAFDTLNTVWSDTAGSCDIELIKNSSIDDLNVLVSSTPGIEDCPQSGSISVSASIDISCTGDGSNELQERDVNGVWTVDAVVNSNQTVTVTVTGDNNTWRIVEPLDCGGSPQ